MHSDAIDKLLKSIDLEYNSDFWWDIERFIVAKMLADLNVSEWVQLQNSWNLLTPQGMIRLVEACNVYDNPICFPLLEKMLSSSNTNLGGIIAGALLELGYTWNPNVAIREDLVRSLEGSSEYEQKQINRLLQLLPS